METSSDREFRSRFLSGQELFGDDFGAADIEAWYSDEAEGYAELFEGSVHESGRGESGSYEYAHLNEYHGFSRVDLASTRSLLALGAFDGAELLPIARPEMQITIVEPSQRPLDALIAERAQVDWVVPAPSGELPFPDGAFDLITCFGVMHHIPNVSAVLRELRRVLAPSGRALVREPISSLGDWREPRPGLTKRERGIPLGWFRQALATARFSIEREALCTFAPLGTIGRKLGRSLLTNRAMVALDAAASSVSKSNYTYHPQSRFARIRPGSVFYVLSPGPPGAHAGGPAPASLSGSPSDT